MTKESNTTARTISSISPDTTSIGRRQATSALFAAFGLGTLTNCQSVRGDTSSPSGAVVQALAGSGSVIWIDTISDLVTTYSATAATAIVQGYNIPGDGGGGIFIWQNSTSSTSPATDGGTIFQVIPPTGKSPGYWKRIYDGLLNVRWFGAFGDNSQDDTVAINSAIRAAIAAHGGVVFLPAGNYKVGSPSSGPQSIAIRIQADNITLRGEGGAASAAVSTTGAASSATRLVFTGSNGSGSKIDLSNALLSLDCEDGVKHFGCAIEDLTLDGNSIANISFLSRAHERVHMRRVTCTGFRVYGACLTNSTSVAGSADNYYEDCIFTPSASTSNAPIGLIVAGGNAGNVNRSTFSRCLFGTYAGTVAASIESADGLTFLGCHWGDPNHPCSIPGAPALVLHAVDTGVLSGSNSQSRSCVFIGCEGPILARAAPGGSAAGHVCYGYTMENVNHYPIIEQGADLTVYATQSASPQNPPAGSLSYGAAFAGCTLSAPSATPIPFGTSTTVTWTNTDWDLFYSGAPFQPCGETSPMQASRNGTIVVPNGIKWARVTAQIAWAINASGARRGEIQRNDTPVAWQLIPSMAGLGSDGGMLLTSPWVRVLGGDTLSLRVLHTASNSGGSSISLALAASCFLQAEWK